MRDARLTDAQIPDRLRATNQVFELTPQTLIGTAIAAILIVFSGQKA
jgi:hypothetical protein